MARQPHTSYSMEKIFRDHQKKQLIAALKPYPMTVTISLEMDGIEFQTVVSGADAIRMFKRDPGTREAIRQLEPGQSTIRVAKVGRVSLMVTHGGGVVKARGIQRIVDPAPFGVDPTTGRPFTSEVDRRQWVANNVENMPSQLIITEPDEEEPKTTKRHTFKPIK